MGSDPPVPSVKLERSLSEGLTPKLLEQDDEYFRKLSTA
jgi:hypothetical protein